MSTIAELMALDPLKLTRDDLAAIVKEHRDNRHLFNTQPAKAAKKETALEKAGVKIDIGELGL